MFVPLYIFVNIVFVLMGRMYGLLDFDIKLYIYLSMLFSVCGRKGNYLVWVRFNESLVLKVYVRDCIM